MSENQIYPQYYHEKNFVLPAGVPMSAVPTTERAPKCPIEIQIPGIVFTGSIGLISFLMAINAVHRANFSFDIDFYRTCCDFIAVAYWGLFVYFSAMAVVFPNHLADDKPDISNIWPIVTAVFIRLFWILQSAELGVKEVLMVLLARALILAGFYFCYFAGKDAWPLGNIFRPWNNQMNYETVKEQV